MKDSWTALIHSTVMIMIEVKGHATNSTGKRFHMFQFQAYIHKWQANRRGYIIIFFALANSCFI